MVDVFVVLTVLAALAGEPPQLPDGAGAVGVSHQATSTDGPRAKASGTEERPPITARDAELDAPGPTDAPAATSADGEDAVQWMEPLMRCHAAGRRTFCDGPRRVPVATGEAAERAAELRLGTRGAAGWLLTHEPPRRWVRAAGGHARRDLLLPVDHGRLGRGFGYVRRAEIHDQRHNGIDIGQAVGTDIFAANDGIVAYADNELRGYGNVVLIVHPDASVTLYAHMSAAVVVAGQLVSRGDKIGELGTTGLSRGPHLHFEWHVDGEPQDPRPHLAFRR